MTAIVETCQNSHHCEPMKALLDECNERVSSKSKTEETCTQELFDFIHCVDHCVSIELGSFHLKVTHPRNQVYC